MFVIKKKCMVKEIQGGNIWKILTKMTLLMFMF